jgi:hypothetical protein
MSASSNNREEILGLVDIIIDREVADLFVRFVEGVMDLSCSVNAEFTRFSVKFSDPCGMITVVSPYRNLFLVVAGEKTKQEVRVTDSNGFVIAMDMVLQYFLKRRSSFLTG